MDKVRWAVVGLGHIAQAAVLPAFEHAKKNCELIALVSGDERKRHELARRYGVRTLHDYSEYDDLLDSGLVDAVYIATPNTEHRDFAIRAANAGVHVLCEKPLAVTEDDCEAMIDAARENGVKLMTAYRLHFERANLEAIEKIRKGAIGDPRIFTSCFSQQVREGNIRTKAELGGGPLYDMGVYCINAARYLFRDEPVEVFGTSANCGDERFREVDDTFVGLLRFPGDRIANFACSFGAAGSGFYRVTGTTGDLHLEPAFDYEGGRTRRTRAGGHATKKTYGESDQFAPELVYFADCILEDRQPEPDGEEGLADVRIVRALLASSREKHPVALPPFERRARPTLDQEIRKPPVETEPPLVEVEPPTA